MKPRIQTEPATERLAFLVAMLKLPGSLNGSDGRNLGRASLIECRPVKNFFSLRRLFWRWACLLLVFGSAFLAMPSRAWVPCFREFVSVNDSGSSNSLFVSAISYDREPCYWDSVAPGTNQWITSVLAGWGQDALNRQAQNVRYLPLLCYTADWAADKSTRSWTNGSTVWKVVPQSGSSNMDYYTYVNGAQTAHSVLTSFGRFPADVNQWSNYVYQVTAYLHAPPYNVQYFQIWNEAYVGNDSFWMGGNNEYMQRVHLPGAQAVHAAGGKVVYGGWPDISTPSTLLGLIDANNAWSSIDVLDLHYYNLGDVQTLRSGADARGWTNIGIWQTEYGYTTDYTANPTYVPRALYWNLTNNWTSNKYEAFWYANWGAPSCYYSASSVLTGNGIALTNMAYVFGGTNALSQFPGVVSTPSLGFNVWNGSSMETFSYSTNIAIAIHLIQTDVASNPSLSLYLPISPNRILSAQRIDLSGGTTNLLGTLTASGQGSQLTVQTTDATNSLAYTWNTGASCPIFYVLVSTGTSSNLALNKPVTASSIESTTNAAICAVDGNVATCWSSAFSDPQWIYVDLGGIYSITRVKLNWEAAYGKSYKIQVSSDAATWTDIYSTTNGQGGINDLTGLSGTGQYVRMYGIQRGTQWGYSLYEFEVYGGVSVPTGLIATGGKGQVLLSWDTTAGATSYNVKRAASMAGPFTTIATVTSPGYMDGTGVSGAAYYYVVSALNSQSQSSNSSPVLGIFARNLALNQAAYVSSSTWNLTGACAVDGNTSSQWLSASSDPQWLYVDLGAFYNVNNVSLNWGYSSPAKAYEIDVSSDANNWTMVYSTVNGAGGIENISFNATPARYVRMYGTQRSGSSGYALNEFQVYGMALPFVLSQAQAGNSIVLSWFADANYSLWSTTNLADPASWSPLTNAVQGTNVLRATVSQVSRIQFFQLRSP